MATDKKTSALTPRGTPDRANDQIYVINGSSYYRSTINNELGISGNPVGDSDTQTLTNKTLTAPTLTSPILNGTITGTYTLGGTPTFPSSVVTLTGTQTLTNKTLTSPTINTPTLTNASISADAITGFTTANSGTIYGLAITNGTHSGLAITNNTIDASKIKWTSTGANAGIWWEELGRATAVTAGTTLTISSIAPRTYLKIIGFFYPASTVANLGMRFNNDATTNYTYRRSISGTADVGAGSQNYFYFDPGSSTVQPFYIEVSIINVATQEKLAMGTVVGRGLATAGANTERVEYTNKWGNTTDQITRVDAISTGGNYAIGSEIIVLGHN